jgi:alanine racemase
VRLRAAGIQARLYVVGPTFAAEAKEIVAANLDVVVFSSEQVAALAAAAVATGTVARVHVKIETGTHRQGVAPDKARELICQIDETAGVMLVGVTTHLADVEDETEHTFARTQLERFQAAVADVPTQVWRHCASSAAHILFPEARWDMVRTGIATYGLWPSRETRISADIVHGGALKLVPVLSWRTRIAQLNIVRKGHYVGYGRAHRVSSDRRIALLPVGYFDGYDRSCSGKASVLMNGHRAPVVGRICMNMTMVDVTDVPDARVGGVVTLLGADGEGTISADELAQWASTISYEIVARIHPRIPRIVT